MKAWLCRFMGRKIGAIGIFYENTIEVEAEDAERARMEVYKTHEHLTGFTATEIVDRPYAAPMTRQRYMAPYESRQEAGRRHRFYYAQMVTPEVRAIVERHFPAAELAISQNKDGCWNEYGLQEWDRVYIRGLIEPLMKQLGDSWSLAGNVCVAKEAAKQNVEAYIATPGGAAAVAEDERIRKERYG